MAVTSKKTKKQQTGVCCMDCKHAICMRCVPQNPIIAVCQFNGERFVARVKKYCNDYEPRTAPFRLSPWVDAT